MMRKEQAEETLDPRVEAVMRALYEVDDTIYDFKIPFDEMGPYRRTRYRIRAKAAIAALGS